MDKMVNILKQDKIVHFLLNSKSQIPSPKFQREPTPNAKADGYACISWNLVFGIWRLGFIKKYSVLRRSQYKSAPISFFLFICCIFFVLSSTAQENSQRYFVVEENLQTGLQVKSISEGTYMLTFVLPYLEIKKKSEGSEIYFQVSVPSTGRYSLVGYPSLPLIQTFISANKSKSVSIDIIELDTVSMYVGKLYPFQKPAKRNIADPFFNPEVFLNKAAYEGVNSFPAAFFQNHGFKMIGSKSVLDVWLNPVIYFPASNSITVTRKIVIKVSFHNDPSFLKAPDNTINIKDNYSSQFIHSALKAGDFIKTTPHLLIITHDDFYKTIQPFVEWKKRKGFIVSVLKTSQIGTYPGDTDIKKVLKDSFAHGGLQYVLLVGDIDFIPAFKGVNLALNDHEYTTMTDSSYLPDFVIGRFCVNDEQECQTYVNKILNYERNTDTTSSATWYHKATSAASSAHLDDQHGRHVTEFFSNHHFTQVDDLRAMLGKFDGTFIKNAIDSGRSWLFYIGHGTSQGWSVNGSFTTNSVLALTNTRMLPAIVSVACANADIDYPGSSLGEKFMKVADDKGAAIFLGATEDTYFFWSDTLGKHALFSYIKGETETFGDAMNYGKLYMYQCFPDDTAGSISEETMQHFIIIGDPSMMPWTEKPRTLHVNYPNIIRPGVDSLYLTINTSVKKITGALVCLSNKDFSFREAGYSDSMGNICLKGNFPKTGYLYLTISGRNLVPLYDSIRVDTLSSPIIYDTTRGKLIIYPNPLSTFTFIKFDRNNLKITYFILYNRLGQEVSRNNNLNSSSLSIVKGHLPAGLYFMKVRDNYNNWYISKLLIQ